MLPLLGPAIAANRLRCAAAYAPDSVHHSHSAVAAVVAAAPADAAVAPVDWPLAANQVMAHWWELPNLY